MYEIVDLSNIGLMIHFRRDVDDRFRNLKTVIEYYRKTSSDLEIVIINDDKNLDKDLKNLCSDNNVKAFFMENDDIYWRTKAFNEASKHLNCEYIISGDTDVIVNAKHLLNASVILKDTPTIGIVYPYNGMFVHLKAEIAKNVICDKSISNLEEQISTLKPIPYFETTNFLVAHPQSKGGMVMFRKSTFIECNGYNPNFRGWGYEDDEILARFQKLGFGNSRVYDETAIAWHLPHDNTVREQHKYYDNNRKHSDFVCECDDALKLLRYMEGWSI
jgi:predicted glycosyltransferase involved in capsule biosynthesis